MDKKPPNKNENIQGKEVDEILKIIKSCVGSTKDSLTIEQLNRDYKFLVGSSIPYRKFQHGTLESFLLSFPEAIRVYNRFGSLYVQAVPSKTTNHIVNLVKGQKPSQTKSNGFSKPVVMRRPQNKSPWKPPTYPSRSPRGHLLPNPSPLFHPVNMKGYGMGYPYYNSQPLKKPRNLPNTGNQITSRYHPDIPRYHPLNNMASRQTNQVAPKTFKAEIEKIARDKGMAFPKYEFSPIGKKKNNFICTVVIGDQKFGSYPEEKKTEEEAAEVACKKAVEYFKEAAPKSSSNLRQTRDYNQVVERIIQILKKNPGTVWWNYVRECYEKEFHESISENWIEEANGRKDRSELQIDNPGSVGWTLQIRSNNTPLSNSKISMNSSNRRCNAEQPDILKLPDDNMWNVFVSYIKDCSEVWFRLIEDEYSSAFEEFVTQMELHYFEEKNQKPISNFVVDAYYICQHEDSWFRIRLVNIEGDVATVFFIDHGDTEMLSSSKLFALDPKFLKFPCQSINACLAGFECGFCDQMILAELQKLALGKTLVVEVLSRDETLSVVFYDTSTADDININEQLMQILPDAYPTPVFPPPGGICEAYVSHVASDGEIYVKLELATFKALESLFHTAKKRAEEILGNDSVCLDMGKLYLAKFSKDGEWHRAVPRNPMCDDDGKVLLKALDNGMQERVFAANIIPLENVSKMLNKIPPQCLPCRLHNIPSKAGLHWTPKASERLISMLPSRTETLCLKVIKKGTDGHLTEVELFKRVEKQNLLVSIAATLDLETNLFKSEDDNNNSSGVENGITSSSFASNGIIKNEVNAAEGTFDVQEIIVPPLPEIKSYFDVIVTNAASPFNFYVQSWKDAMKLDWLMREMKIYYSLPSNTKRTENIKPGRYYALQHSDDNWHRVRIDKILADFVSGTLIDCGEMFCSNSELSKKVQPLPQSFRQLPYQAFKAKVGGIVPINKDWTPEDSFRFRELVEKRPFVSIVTNIETPQGNDPPLLTLRLIDTSDPEVDKYIDDILVTEKRAQKTN